MALATIYPEAEETANKNGLKIKPFGVNKGYLSQARTVLEYSPALVDNVLVGWLHL